MPVPSDANAAPDADAHTQGQPGSAHTHSSEPSAHTHSSELLFRFAASNDMAPTHRGKHNKCKPNWCKHRQHTQAPGQARKGGRQTGSARFALCEGGKYSGVRIPSFMCILSSRPRFCLIVVKLCVYMSVSLHQQIRNDL